MPNSSLILVVYEQFGYKGLRDSALKRNLGDAGSPV